MRTQKCVRSPPVSWLSWKARGRSPPGTGTLLNPGWWPRWWWGRRGAWGRRRLWRRGRGPGACAAGTPTTRYGHRTWRREGGDCNDLGNLLRALTQGIITNIVSAKDTDSQSAHTNISGYVSAVYNITFSHIYFLTVASIVALWKMTLCFFVKSKWKIEWN